MSGIWDTLGVDAGADRDTVRRAYARKLRVTHPEDDPEGFKRLREAYEIALRQIAHRTEWGDDGIAEEERPEPTSLFAEPLRPPVFRSEPVEPPPSVEARDGGEIAALLAARDAERAQLHAAMRALDAALRGSWRASDEELEARFNDILAAPALGEFAVRDEVEAWSADLIAATVPRSDAILLAAVTHFGWAADRERAPISDAVHACLARLDEWRIIEELNHHRHPLNAAWRSLTRPAGGWFFWRIDALRPGVASGAETLLGRRGPVSEGLHFSFKADSLARWERLLGRPHITLAMLAAAPIAALLAYILAANLSPAIGLWATIAAAILAPILLFALHVLRFANLRGGVSGWAQDGWMLGYVAVGALAVLLPVSPWSVAAFGAVALLLWGWMTATVVPPAWSEIRGRFGAVWLPGLIGIAVGALALPGFPVTRALVLLLMVVLYVAVRLGGWNVGVAGLWRTLAQGPGVALASVAAVMVPTVALTLVALGKVPGYYWLYAAGLIVLAALPIVAAMQGLSDRAAQLAKAVRIALLVMLGAAWVAALDSVPRPKNAPVAVTLPVAGTEEAVPQADAPGTLHGDIVAALTGDNGGDVLATIADKQPGFGQIEQGNPALYEDIQQVVRDRVGGRLAVRDGADIIVKLIAQSYRDRLPATNDGLVREEFAIRLSRLKALQRESDGACVSPRWQLDELTVQDAVRRRQTAQALNVVSNPLERGLGGGQLSVDELDARAAATAGDDLATYRINLAGRNGAGPQCATMIARMQALNGNLYQTDPSLVTTMRAELVRENVTQRKPLE